jgi:predicted oxidoreductase
MQTGHEHTWFILTQKIIEKEFALSGSEQNPDITGKSVRRVMGRAGGGAPAPVRAFMERGKDFIVERDLKDLVRRMNAMTPEAPLDYDQVEREVVARGATATGFGAEGWVGQDDVGFGQLLSLAAQRVTDDELALDVVQ